MRAVKRLRTFDFDAALADLMDWMDGHAVKLTRDGYVTLRSFTGAS